MKNHSLEMHAATGPSTEPSPESLTLAAHLFHVLGERSRLGILLALEESEKSVNDLSECLDIEQTALSHQLRILRDARLVKVRQDGRQRFYSLDDDHVRLMLRDVIEHVEEVPHA